MLVRNCTQEDLHGALRKVNILFEDNIEFRDIEQKTKNSIRFTLKCKDSKKAGHRVHYQIQDPFGHDPHYKTRRGNSACWHVHGHFFDALFELAPEAKVISRGETFTKDRGNWIDVNIGSILFPFYLSDSCDCNT